MMCYQKLQTLKMFLVQKCKQTMLQIDLDEVFFFFFFERANAFEKPKGSNKLELTERTKCTQIENPE